MPLPANWVDGIGMQVDADYLNENDTTTNANTEAVEDLVSKIGLAVQIAQPPSTGWSDINFETAGTASTDDGDQLLTVTTASGVKHRMRTRSLSPTSNYEARFILDPIYPPLSAAIRWSYGVFVRESSSGKFIKLSFGDHSSGSATGDYRVEAFPTPNTTSPDSTYATATERNPLVPRFWAIEDNGTNHIFKYSWNGKDWKTLHSQSRTTYITANEVGFFVHNESGETMRLRLRGFEIIS